MTVTAAFLSGDRSQLSPDTRYALAGAGLAKPSLTDAALLATGGLAALPLTGLGAVVQQRSPWLPARRKIIPMPPGVPAAAVAAVEQFERALPFALHENTTRVLGLPTALGGFGFKQLTAVQLRTLPPLAQGRDALIRAPTGTGKTLSYLIPVVEQLLRRRVSPTQRKFSAVIVAPTRELALQISAAAQHLLALHGRLAQSQYRVATLIGGGSSLHEDQQPLMSDDPAIVVGTPGRLAAHIAQTPGFRTRCRHASVLVLDEVDYLLALGFKNDLTAIVGAVKAQRQTVMLSATLSPAVRLVAHYALRRGHDVLDLIADPTGRGAEALKQRFEQRVREDQEEHYRQYVQQQEEQEQGVSKGDAEATDAVEQQPNGTETDATATATGTAPDASKSRAPRFGLEHTGEFEELNEQDDWSADAAATVRAAIRQQNSASAANEDGDAVDDDAEFGEDNEDGDGLVGYDSEEAALAAYVSETPVTARQMMVTAPISEQLPTLARLFDDIGGRFMFARQSVYDSLHEQSDAEGADGGIAHRTAAARANDNASDNASASAEAEAAEADEAAAFVAWRAGPGRSGNAPVANISPSQSPFPVNNYNNNKSGLTGDDDAIPMTHSDLNGGIRGTGHNGKVSRKDRREAAAAAAAAAAKLQGANAQAQQSQSEDVSESETEWESDVESDYELSTPGAATAAIFAAARTWRDRERLLDATLPRPPKIVVFLPTARLAQFAAAVFRRVLAPHPEPAPADLRKRALAERARRESLRHAWGGVLELHSRRSQTQRVRAVEEFGRNAWRGGAVLFASDVASRGLDFDDVDLVVQVGLPPSRNQYIHRVGRTARAGKDGSALLVVAPYEADAAGRMVQGLPVTDVELDGVELPALDELLQRAEANMSQNALTHNASAIVTDFFTDQQELAKSADSADSADAEQENENEDEAAGGQELWDGVVARACVPLLIPPSASATERSAVLSELRGQVMSARTGALWTEADSLERSLRLTLARVLVDETLGLHADRAWVSWLGLHRVRKLRSKGGDVLSVQLEAVKRPQTAGVPTVAELVPLAREQAGALGLRGPFGDGDMPVLAPAIAAKLGLTGVATKAASSASTTAAAAKGGATESAAASAAAVVSGEEEDEDAVKEKGFVIGEPRKWGKSIKEQGGKKERRARWGKQQRELRNNLNNNANSHGDDEYGSSQRVMGKKTLTAQRREVMKGSEQMSRPTRGRTGEVHYKWHA